MKIESIEIKNYKVFKHTLIKDIPKMAVLLGVNGAGKTTFFDVLGFLKDCLEHNVSEGISLRGGFNEVISRGCKTEKDNISIEIKFRTFLEEKQNSPLVTYRVEIACRNNQPYVKREILQYRRGQRGRPWRFLDFQDGSGYAITNEYEYGNEKAEQQRIEQKVSSPDILAIKGLGQFEQFKTISSFRELLERWYVSNFKIEAGKRTTDTGIAHHLSVSGDNLAQVTKYMYESHKDVFDEILKKLPQRIPGIAKVEAKQTEDGGIILRFQDEAFKDPFVGRYVSDGTIKMFAYMILLHDPKPHPLLCIEEPENFLHPDLLLLLCEEIREYSSKGGQVFISTHSPDFVNGLKIEELYFLLKKGGFSVVKSAAEGESGELVKKLVAENNQLGWLWRNHYIQGANL